MSPKLLTIKELAAILQRPLNTLKNDLVKNPAALPPSFKLPGTRCRRWRQPDVDAWVDQLASGQIPEPKPPSKAPVKLGRPRRPV